MIEAFVGVMAIVFMVFVVGFVGYFGVALAKWLKDK